MVGAKKDKLGVPGTQFCTASPTSIGTATDGTCKLGDPDVMKAWVQATGENTWTTSCDMAWGGGRECSAFADDMGANTQWVNDAGEYKRTRNCNEAPLHVCPVDCEAEPWQPWSTCTATCGGCVSTRTRKVKIPDANGGMPCMNHCAPGRAGCTTPDLHTQ